MNMAVCIPAREPCVVRGFTVSHKTVPEVCLEGIRDGLSWNRRMC